MSGMQEYESEPIPGLPEALPEGEQLLWQGAPTVWGIASQVLWAPYVAVYFVALMVWNMVSTLLAGGSLIDVLSSNIWLAPIACTGIGILSGLAWGIHRSTVYTITNRRVVMRFGLALPMAVNIPFGKIESAAVSLRTDGSGNIPLVLNPDHRMFYLMMWPHVRPWGLSRPEPMLRSVPNAAMVADKLGRALAAHAAANSGAIAEPARRRPIRPVVRPTPRSTGAAVASRAAAN